MYFGFKWNIKIPQLLYKLKGFVIFCFGFTWKTHHIRASFGLAFYDADEKYISGYQFKQGENDIEKITLEVPENATQFRTTFYKDRESFVYIPLIKGSLPELEKRISALENATTNQN